MQKTNQPKTNDKKTNTKSTKSKKETVTKYFLIKNEQLHCEVAFVTIVPKVDIVLTVSPGCTQDSLIF